MRLHDRSTRRAYLLVALAVTAATVIGASACAPSTTTGTAPGETTPPAAAPANALTLPAGWRPEGIAASGTTLYVGSIPTGKVMMFDLGTGESTVVVDPPKGSAAIGIKADGKGRLFVAGGPTGKAFVYDAGTGKSLAEYTLVPSGDRFINDVVLTADGAWFTDSLNPNLYKVPIGADGTPGPPDQVVKLPLSGAFKQVPGENNANGIAAAGDGAQLIIVQSSTGKLFTVDPTSGATKEIALSGGDVKNGDGLLLDGQTLFAVQNRLNQVAVIDLAQDLASGTVTQRLTDPQFDVPTTVAQVDGKLYLPNARFGTQAPETAEYSVVAIDKP